MYFSGMKRAGSCSSSSSQIAFAIDARLDVAVGRARDAHADRAGRAVARQSDDLDVEGEVLAPELGADAGLAGHLQRPLLELAVAKGLTEGVALGGQAIEVAGRGELHRLQARLGRCPADDEDEVVGRAGGRARGFASSRP